MPQIYVHFFFTLLFAFSFPPAQICDKTKWTNPSIDWVIVAYAINQILQDFFSFFWNELVQVQTLLLQCCFVSILKNLLLDSSPSLKVRESETRKCSPSVGEERKKNRIMITLSSLSCPSCPHRSSRHGQCQSDCGSCSSWSVWWAYPRFSDYWSHCLPGCAG